MQRRLYGTRGRVSKQAQSEIGTQSDPANRRGEDGLDRRRGRAVAEREVNLRMVRQMPAPATATLAVLHDVRYLAVYEPKVSWADITSTGPTRGCYEASGRLAVVLRWHGTFGYELTDDGFHSWSIGPVGPFEVSGWFTVEPVGTSSCLVIHYEQYRLPAARPYLSRMLAIAVRRTMATELENLERLARADRPSRRHRDRTFDGSQY